LTVARTGRVRSGMCHRAAREATARSGRGAQPLVTRVRAGICGADSVKETVAQAGCWQRHRRLRQSSRVATGKGRCRGWVVTQPFTEVPASRGRARLWRVFAVVM